jgi:hypothetical protein
MTCIGLNTHHSQGFFKIFFSHTDTNEDENQVFSQELIMC